MIVFAKIAETKYKKQLKIQFIMDQNLIHPKEKNYFIILVVISIILYICLAPVIIAVGIFAIPFIIVSILLSWIFSQLYKAKLYSHCVEVSQNQYPKLYNIALEQSIKLDIELPKIFISNSNGEINAIAIRVYLSEYIILNSSIVDLYLMRDAMDELEMIIGHELGHHAANHLTISKKLLTFPGMIFPILGAAYNRACELTADRIGFSLLKDKSKGISALLTTTHGTISLASITDPKIFLAQQNNLSEIAAFINKIYASHPAMTIRISELFNLTNSSAFLPKNEYLQEHNTPNIMIADKCNNCNNNYNLGDKFCEHCGNKLYN